MSLPWSLQGEHGPSDTLISDFWPQSSRRQPPCNDEPPDGGTGTLTKWEDIERGREKKHAVRAGEARLGDLPGPRRSAFLTATPSTPSSTPAETSPLVREVSAV